MTLAVAEMYVQGVSIRKITAIVEEFCGLDLTSMQVSRAAAKLDEQLGAWRNRPIGEITYLMPDARYAKVRHGGAIVPKIAMRPELAGDLRRVFDADEPAKAERQLRDVAARHQKAAPQLRPGSRGMSPRPAPSRRCPATRVASW